MNDETPKDGSFEAGSKEISDLVVALRSQQKNFARAHEALFDSLRQCQAAFVGVMEVYEALIAQLPGLDVEHGPALQAPGCEENKQKGRGHSTPGDNNASEGPGPLHRHVLSSRPTPLGAVRSFAPGARVLITDDGIGVAAGLLERLILADAEAEFVSDLDAALDSACAFDAVVFLGGLRAPFTIDDAFSIPDAAIDLAHRLHQRWPERGCHFVTVQDTGGAFGLLPFDPVAAPLGGVFGLTRELGARWPNWRFKAIDLCCDGRAAGEIADAIAQELLGGGEQSEVGLPAPGERIVMGRSPQVLHATPLEHINDASIVLAALCATEEGAFCPMEQAILELARRCRPKFLLAERASGQRGGQRLARALDEAGSEVRVCTLDLEHFDELMRAVDDVHADWGPISAMLYELDAGSVGEEEAPAGTPGGSSLAIHHLSMMIAVTVNDPLRLIALRPPYGAVPDGGPAVAAGERMDHITANIMRNVVHAERARRGESFVAKVLWVQAAATNEAAHRIADELQFGPSQDVDVVFSVAQGTLGTRTS